MRPHLRGLQICNPRKWGRISRERGFANAARALWQRESFDLVQSHERIPGCDLYSGFTGPCHSRVMTFSCR